MEAHFRHARHPRHLVSRSGGRGLVDLKVYKTELLVFQDEGKSTRRLL